MQLSSPEFDDAIQGDIVWADPTLRVGWHGNQPLAPSSLSQGHWEDEFQRSAPDSWVAKTLYTWDAGTQGWVGEGSTVVAMDAGRLKATNTLGAGTGAIRINDAQGVRNLAADGPTLRVLAQLAPGTPGTNWLARIEVQDAAFGWHGGPDTYIVAGAGWLELRYTPPPELLANMRAIGVQFLADNVNATVDAFVDNMVQFTPEADALWESGTSNLLDVVPGLATIANNVVGSTRGALYQVKDGAGNYFLMDWEVFAVFSSDVLPVGGSYAWVLRFQDAAMLNWNDLWITVELTTNRVYYQSYRNAPPSFGDTVIETTYIPALAYTVGKRLAARWGRAGEQILVKVWDYDVDTEPQEWLSVATDVRPQFLGAPQLRSNLNGGNINGTVTFAYHRFHLKDMRWIGDLTPQMDEDYGVAQAMDDGMPNALSSSLAGEPQAALEAILAGRRQRGVELDARQYFSPFNATSLVYGYPRDLAPVQLEHGLVTVNGSEMVRLFTGQMSNVMIQGRAARLQAVSSTRLKLMRGVRPPIVNGPLQGAEITWLANYLLWACGVNVAPPVDSATCQIYIPGAGSMRPYLPFAEGTTEYSAYNTPVDPGEGPVRPTFRDGPFLRAVNSTVNRMAGPLYVYPNMGFRYRQDGVGSHYLTRSNCRGRMEFWLFGTTADPEVDGSFSALGNALAYWRLANGSSGRMQLTVDADRQLYWQENIAARVFLTGLTLPADNAWHALGMYYDYSTNRVVVHLDGEERSFTPSPALDVLTLETTDDNFRSPEFWSAIPYAELRLHTGIAAVTDPALVGWDAQLTRTPGSVVAFEDWEDTSYNVTWSGFWARANDQAFAGTWSLKSSISGSLALNNMFLTIPNGVRELQFQVRLDNDSVADNIRVWHAFLYHTFSTTVSNGWPTPDIGPAFAVIGTASDYSSNGSVGQQSLGSANVERMAYVDTGNDDGEVQADVAFGVASATGASIRIRLRGRGTGANTSNNYYTSLELDTSGNVYISLNKRVLGVTTNLVPATLLGANGVGSSWRVRFAWAGTQLRATGLNITSPTAPVTISANTEGLTFGERVYFSGIRDTGNTVATTITFDNLMVNGVTLYGGSGHINAWQLATVHVPEGATKLLFRNEKANSVSTSSVWIDNLELRNAPSVTSSFEPQAIMRGIEVDIEAVVQDAPREAWGWLSEICQSTMTNMRANELDVMMVLPPRYFVEPDQLVVNDTLSTEWNTQDPDITMDPSKIRNSVQVDFGEVTIDTGYVTVLAFKTVLTVPRGVHQYEFTLDMPAVTIVPNLTPQSWTITPPTVPQTSSAVYANTIADGSGTRLGSNSFTATIVEWTAQTAVVEFDNRTGANAYLVHNLDDDTPYLSISGKGVHSREASASVQSVQPGRPERTVTVQAPAIQTRAEARSLAAALLVWTSRPRAEVSLRVLGDPRRQPGDLYELVDEEGTKVTGQWRPLAISHNRSGSEFVQDMVLREVLPVANWDDNSAGWDEGVWS